MMNRTEMLEYLERTLAPMEIPDESLRAAMDKFASQIDAEMLEKAKEPGDDK